MTILGAIEIFIYNARTRPNGLKQLAFLDDEHLNCFFPKMLKVVHRRLFTNPSQLVREIKNGRRP